MIEEYEKWNTSFIKQNSQSLHKLLCMLTMREKSSRVSNVICYNVDNSEMILGRALSIRADDVMEAQKNF